VVKKGSKLFHVFKELLGPKQVYDVTDGGPSKGLSQIKDIPNIRILVAGGDGSVGWILSEIDKIQFKISPPVAVLPLGTGNDLARTLNWGGGYDGEQLIPILKQIERAQIAPLDRWQLQIIRPNGVKTKVMNNYFSLGSDAEIALGFHNKREERPDLFTGRFVNKLWYTWYGSKVLFKFETPLNQLIDLEVDGNLVPLKSNLYGLIVLNLSSYAAGADLWGREATSQFAKPSFSDGLLELLGIKGTFEMGASTAQLTKPKKVAQGRNLKIVCKRHGTPLQVDGEPWREEEPCILKISLLNQASMLFNVPSK